MKLLLTGLSGTLAPKLSRVAAAAGCEVVGWSRHAVNLEDTGAIEAHLRHLRPQAIAHLALGPMAWAQHLALHAAAHGLPLVVTSSAMVFEPDGPHRPGDAPTAPDGYGRYKRDVESAVQAACASACIARLGWQIDADGIGNNMVAHLDRLQAEHGRIDASRLWRPACSFMDDTARALLALLTERVQGVVHLDSNARDGHGFDAIVRALATHCGRTHWRVRADESYRHDQRLIGNEARMPALAERLPGLGCD